MNKYLATATVTLILALAPAAKADIVTTIGNTGSALVNGTSGYSSLAFTTAQTGSPAPFNASCGSDAGSNGSTNCSASWTFGNAAVGSGLTVTGANLTLGIGDIDSAAPGDQVKNFAITGGDNLTTTFNTVAEALNGGLGSKNAEYDIFTFTLSSFSALASGNTNVSLSLQDPGLGVLGDTPSNGAFLIFSTLDIQTTPVVSGVPEPSTWVLLLAGIGSIVWLKRVRKTNLVN